MWCDVHTHTCKHTSIQAHKHTQTLYLEFLWLDNFFFETKYPSISLKKAHQLYHYAFLRDCATIEANLYHKIAHQLLHPSQNLSPFLPHAFSNHITFKLSFLCYHHIHSIHLIRRNGILHTYPLSYYWLQDHIPTPVFRYGCAFLNLFYCSKTSNCFQINIHEF